MSVSIPTLRRSACAQCRLQYLTDLLSRQGEYVKVTSLIMNFKGQEIGCYMRITLQMSSKNKL